MHNTLLTPQQIDPNCTISANILPILKFPIVPGMSFITYLFFQPGSTVGSLQNEFAQKHQPGSDSVRVCCLCVSLCKPQECVMVALSILSHWSHPFWALGDSGTDLNLAWMCDPAWSPLPAAEVSKQLVSAEAARPLTSGLHEPLLWPPSVVTCQTLIQECCYSYVSRHSRREAFCLLI